MRGDSRHGPPRPERAGGRAARPRPEGGPQGGGTAARDRGEAGRPQTGRSQGGRSRDGRPQGGRPQTGRPQSGRPAGGAAAVDVDRLIRLLEPVVHAAGMDLETVRVSAAGRRLLLRVVVDADGGVGLDDIALISREVSLVLDADDEMGEAPYTLEVSSPGVDRPLTLPKHWRRATGRLVSVTLAGDGRSRGRDGRDRAASVQGRVTAVSAEGVTLEIDGTRREFGYDDLGPGRVQVEFGRPAGEPGDDGGDGGEPDGY
ncbi:MAG: ribosome maturation factor RimP [Gemmatimonadota bacterium]